MRSAIAKPAASSFDELTRRPEDRRCSEVASDSFDVARLRCAFSDEMLAALYPSHDAYVSAVNAATDRAVRDGCVSCPVCSRRFDPARVIDKATFAKPDQYSEGIPFVLVGGVFVVLDGKLVQGYVNWERVAPAMKPA
jgi:hypothetical protein